jgi:hypothetical protein
MAYHQDVLQAASGDDPINKQLLTWVDPFLGAITGIADEDVTAAILKSTDWSSVITVPATVANPATVLLVVPFHSPRRSIRVYVLDNVTPSNGVHLLTQIEQSEDLSTNFKLMRFISAGLKVKSATVSGAVFTVSGTINSILYQELPEVRNLTFPTLLQYKRDNVNALASVNIEDGVVALALPDSEHEFVVPETLNTFEGESQQIGISTFTAWNTTVQSVSGAKVRVYDSAVNDTTIVPPNTWGHIRPSFFLYLKLSSVGGDEFTINVEYKVNYRTVDPATWVMNPVVSSRTMVSQQFLLTTFAVAQQSFNMMWDTYIEEEVLSLSVDVTVSWADVGSSWNVDTGTFSSARLVTYSNDRHGIQGPGAIIAMQGLIPNQQINVGGKANYEVVPNSQLAPNVPTTYTLRRSPWEFDVATAVLAEADRFGLKFLYTGTEWNLKESNQFFHTIANSERASLMASSTKSRIGHLMRMLGRNAKPLARAALPALGTAIGAAYGAPEIGAMVGQAGARMFANTRSADKMYASTTGPDPEGPEVEETPNFHRHCKLGYTAGSGWTWEVLPPGPCAGHHLAYGYKCMWGDKLTASSRLAGILGRDPAPVPAGVSFASANELNLLRANVLGPDRMNAILIGGAKTNDLMRKMPVVKFGSANFPAVFRGVARVVRLLVSDQPIKFQDRRCAYRDAEGRPDIHFDILLEEVEGAEGSLMDCAVKSFGTGEVFVSVDTNGLAIGGKSWHAACASAAKMLPNNVLISGSESEAATDLGEKLALAMEENLKLIVVNPDPTDLETVRAMLGGSDIRLVGVGSALNITTEKTAGYVVPSYLYAGLLTLALGALGTAQKIDLEYEVARKAAAREVGAQSDSGQTETMQEVFIGGKGVMFDVTTISPDYDDEHAEAYAALNIPSNKMSNYINASAYRSAARLAAQVSNWEAKHLGATAKPKKKKGKSPAQRPSASNPMANLMQVMRERRAAEET